MMSRFVSRSCAAVLFSILLVVLVKSVAGGNSGYQLSSSALASSPVDVVTYHNDNARDGVNAKERILALANVRSATFGKLRTLPVDGVIDAQPLYLSAVSIPDRGVHNIIYAVTENDSVYA